MIKQRTFPGEVLVIQGVVAVQTMEVLRQLPWGPEVVDVDVGMGWSDATVLVGGRPHHDGNDVMSENRHGQLTVHSLQGAGWGWIAQW